MPYRMNRLYVKNFKCFDNKCFYCFKFDESLNPTILAGPNGFGKTTFFDAVELIFTKSITRLRDDIEDNRINLGKNILLNESGSDGLLVLNIIDESNNELSIVTRIDYKNEKLSSIHDSISYKVSSKGLKSEDDIIDFLQTEGDWSPSLSDCIELKYSTEHFNVYYYISQAESVHFLKRNIRDRKSSVNSLLNTDIVDSHIDYIEKKLIGGTKSKKGVLINDELAACEASIKEYVNLIKDKQKENPLSSQYIEYKQLLDYPDKLLPFPWDIEDVLFDKTMGYASLQDMLNSIESLYQFSLNRDDYSAFLENESIEKIVNNKQYTDDYINYYDFMTNGILDRNGIVQHNLMIQNRLELYKHSTFFIGNFDISLFKKEDLIKIRSIDESLITCDIESISNIVKEILDNQKELSEEQAVLTKLQIAREELHNHALALEDATHCPYCYHPFTHEADLESAFGSLSKRLSERNNMVTEKIKILQQDLKNKLETDQKNILKEIEGLDENTSRKLSLNITRNQQFIDNEARINMVAKIHQYLNNKNSWLSLAETEKAFAVEQLLQKEIKAYANPEFLSALKTYEFQKNAILYDQILSLEQPLLHERESIERKIQYLKKKYANTVESELSSLIEKLKSELIKKQKLEALRKSLDSLKTLYKNSIEAYRNQIIKKLRIPLLIYSGKILQDYQNGLGVFISRDEMRFVANGDAKHDILNTFSSGQLSGFVLSFLFAMNKQYITKSNDDIGFILVDDPVQTMDDINIASFIEVLRNDFGNKQIILSTHEVDKENYILYKFLKFNLRGQSFNVKEQLYL